MKRQHLFDHGYPVTTATRLAGSEVLLAVARHALRLSRQRLESSRVALASAGISLVQSRGTCRYTRLLTHGKDAHADRPVQAGAAIEPR